MLTLCYAPSYGIEICEARRLTTEEKRHYAAWFAETGFIGVGSHVDLPCISHEDLPNRSDDGSFLGCYNQAWIITEAEAASYEKLNRQRQNEKDLAQKLRKMLITQKLPTLKRAMKIARSNLKAGRLRM